MKVAGVLKKHLTKNDRCAIIQKLTERKQSNSTVGLKRVEKAVDKHEKVC